MRQLPQHALWIGHAGDGRNAAQLIDAGTELVVQLAYEEPPLTLPREIAVCRVPLIDGGDNAPRHLELAIDLVEKSLSLQLPTLVCCSAGLSRSPAIVAAALARLREVAFAHCLAEVAKLGPIDVSPALWAQICEGSERRG